MLELEPSGRQPLEVSKTASKQSVAELRKHFYRCAHQIAICRRGAYCFVMRYIVDCIDYHTCYN